MKIKQIVTSNGNHYGHTFVCPGCHFSHVVPSEPYPGGWTWNGSTDRPSFVPSILFHPTKRMGDDEVVVETPLCHSIVTNGRICFLSDCTHSLAGQIVELPEMEGC